MFSLLLRKYSVLLDNTTSVYEPGLYFDCNNMPVQFSDVKQTLARFLLPSPFFPAPLFKTHPMYDSASFFLSQLQICKIL